MSILSEHPDETRTLTSCQQEAQEKCNIYLIKLIGNYRSQFKFKNKLILCF